MQIRELSWSRVGAVGVVALGMAIVTGQAQSVVDRSFSSQLVRDLGLYEMYAGATVQPLASGGVLVHRSEYRGWRYELFDRLTATGEKIADFSYTPGRYFNDAVIAMLPDGTYFMNVAPFRRTTLEDAVNSFSLGISLEAGGNPVQVKLQRDGKLLIGQGTMLRRVDPLGAIDSAFSFTGSPLATLAHIEIDSRDRLILVSYDGATSKWRIERSLSDGTADHSFAPIEALEPLQITVLADDSLAVGRSVDSGLATLVPTASDSHARFAHYDGNGRLVEEWDLGNWSGIKLIAPDASVYVAYQNLIYRLTGAPSFRQDASFFATLSPGVVNSLALDGSQLYVAGSFTRVDDWPTNDIARLDVTKCSGRSPPAVTVGRGPERLGDGISFTLSAAAIGTGPLRYEWLSLDGGQLPVVSDRPALRFEKFVAANLGRYQLRVTGAEGTAVSNIVDLRATEPVRLTNLSGRARVGPGDDVAIAGFVADAPADGATILLRGVGPGLSAYSIASALADPQLSLRDASGAEVDANDNWDDSGLTPYWTAQAGAFPLIAGSKDAAIVRNIRPGPSTLILRSRAGDSGVALAEVYDCGTPLSGKLRNLSLRGHVGTGEDTLIAGFVVADPQGFGRKVQLLIRAVGPTLTQYGVTHPVLDPKLTVRDSGGAVIATNDNWSDSAQSCDISAYGDLAQTFPLPAQSADAAAVLSLAPGTYTAQATPATGGEGIGLVEIYHLQ